MKTEVEIDNFIRKIIDGSLKKQEIREEYDKIRCNSFDINTLSSWGCVRFEDNLIYTLLDRDLFDVFRDLYNLNVIIRDVVLNRILRSGNINFVKIVVQDLVIIEERFNAVLESGNIEALKLLVLHGNFSYYSLNCMIKQTINDYTIPKLDIQIVKFILDNYHIDNEKILISAITRNDSHFIQNYMEILINDSINFEYLFSKCKTIECASRAR